jgi:hypothetical protein
MERRKEACVWFRTAPIDVESLPSIYPSISMMVSKLLLSYQGKAIMMMVVVMMVVVVMMMMLQKLPQISTPQSNPSIKDGLN